MTATLRRTGPRRTEPREEPLAPPQRSTERLRLAAIFLALVLAVFAQSAGNTSTDTKIDLAISPWRFLGRALQLWDPIGGAGQLQNQAYGYLFPIGPFYGVLHGLGLPAWEVQRGFEAAIVCAAFLGCYLLARRLGVDGFWPAVAAGLTYALAPRVLGELTSISAELMPVAALPWIVLPLVAAAERGSPRKAAARSGVALLFAGGVNAAATVAMLPVPLLWLLTRSRGPRRRALVAWWFAAVALASAWWAIPLLLLGKYSPPFLDWIETSSITTAPTSIVATLRGVDHWESYLGSGVWPGAWILASAPAAVLATCLVAAAGLAGLARREVKHQLFLWSCLVLGTVLVTIGHVVDVGSPVADGVRSLLDGALVPFRNVHKFDPLIRLPLAIGVGQLLLRVRVARRQQISLGKTSREGLVLPMRALAALAVLAIGAVALTPIWTNHLVSSQRVTAEPSWWANAAHWLHDHDRGSRALVVPATGSPQYLWGGTIDNAMQPVALSPWTVRDGVPLTQAGYVRLLDAIDDILAGGVADARLAPLLSRSGIGYVVVANDLKPVESSSTSSLYVRSTLENSPGIYPAAGFGPALGGSTSANISIDSGGSYARPAVQIYSVAGTAGRASLDPLSDTVTATGSSDTLTQLVGRGLQGDQAVLYGSDADGVTADHSVVTDGIRRREAGFTGLLQHPLTMTQAQPYQQRRKVHDYLPSGAGALSAYSYGGGLANVSASSSGADSFAFVNRGDGNGAWSAVDGDPTTSWQSTGSRAVGQWLQLDLTAPTTVRTVQISFAAPDDPPAPLPTKLSLLTNAGTSTVDVLPLPGKQTITLPPGAWSDLRVTIAAVQDDSPGTSVAISALTVPGLTPTRSLVLPGSGAPSMLAFDAALGYRPPCLPLTIGTVCDPGYGTDGQEDSGIDRQFTLSEAASYLPSATVRVKPGRALNALLNKGMSVHVHASSVISTDPRKRAAAAVDGDPATAWQAAQGDIHPKLTLSWQQARNVSGLTVYAPVASPVAPPLKLTVTAGDQTWHGALPVDGHITLPASAFTNTVTITIDKVVPRTTVNSVSLASSLIPTGITEVQLDHAPSPPPLSDYLTVPCGRGPILALDGKRTAMSITGTRADLIAGAAVSAQPCHAAAVPLSATTHRVYLAGSKRFTPVSVTLTRPGYDLRSAPVTGESLAITSWGATARTIDVHTTKAALCVVHENFNSGWHAALDGTSLRAVRVDGWQQGFVVPANSTGTVQLTYAPQRGFQVGLIVGAACAIAVVALAFWRTRRPDTMPPLRDGVLPRSVIAGLAVLGAAALAGWAGIAVAAAIAAVTILLGRTAGAVLSWLAAGLLALAGLLSAFGAELAVVTRQDEPSVQLLCVAALAAGCAGAVVGRRSRGGV